MDVFGPSASCCIEDAAATTATSGVLPRFAPLVSESGSAIKPWIQYRRKAPIECCALTVTAG